MPNPIQLIHLYSNYSIITRNKAIEQTINNLKLQKIPNINTTTKK